MTFKSVQNVKKFLKKNERKEKRSKVLLVSLVSVLRGYMGGLVVVRLLVLAATFPALRLLRDRIEN